MFESTVTAAVNTAELRKIRGAFFIPNAITRYVTDWAVKTAPATVLEPSSGDAAFLVRAVRRLCEPDAPTLDSGCSCTAPGCNQSAE